MTDSEITKLYFERDEQAIRSTDEKYGGLCAGIAYNILGDMRDAQEVKDDTYLSLWQSIPPKRPDPLSAFIAKVARNLSLKRLRQRLAQKRSGGEYTLCLDEIADIALSLDDTERKIEEGELIAAVNRFLSKQKKDSRRVFVLRYFGLYKVGDISKKLGFSESKVKSSLARTRERLKEYLESEGFI